MRIDQHASAAASNDGGSPAASGSGASSAHATELQRRGSDAVDDADDDADERLASASVHAPGTSATGTALDDFEFAIKLNGRNSAALHERARIELAAGHCELAVASLTSALEALRAGARTEAAVLHMERARARLMSGAKDSAMTDATAAIDMDPDVGAAWRVLTSVCCGLAVADNSKPIQSNVCVTACASPPALWSSASYRAALTARAGWAVLRCVGQRRTLTCGSIGSAAPCALQPDSSASASHRVPRVPLSTESNPLSASDGFRCCACAPRHCLHARQVLGEVQAARRRWRRATEAYTHALSCARQQPQLSESCSAADDHSDRAHTLLLRSYAWAELEPPDMRAALEDALLAVQLSAVPTHAMLLRAAQCASVCASASRADVAAGAACAERLAAEGVLSVDRLRLSALLSERLAQWERAAAAYLHLSTLNPTDTAAVCARAWALLLADPSRCADEAAQIASSVIAHGRLADEQTRSVRGTARQRCQLATAHGFSLRDANVRVRWR